MTTPDSRAVRIAQWCVASTAVMAMTALVTWLIHLIRTAFRWQDVPSASIGISLVAIPVFVTLLSVLLSVFIGLLTDRSRS